MCVEYEREHVFVYGVSARVVHARVGVCAGALMRWRVGALARWCVCV